MEPLRARRPISQPRKEEDSLWVWLCAIGPFVLIAIVGGAMFLEKLEQQHARELTMEKARAAYERQQLEAELAMEREKQLAGTHPRVTHRASDRAATAAVSRYHDHRMDIPAERQPTAKERYERTAEIYRSMRTTPPPARPKSPSGSAVNESTAKSAIGGWECQSLAEQKDRIEKTMRENRYGNGQHMRNQLNRIWGRMVELGCAR